jgi:hypothetical protein
MTASSAGVLGMPHARDFGRRSAACTSFL